MTEEPPTTNLTGLTWDEFLALPYETRNTSLIDGEVVVNSPNARHELIVHNLHWIFREWLSSETGSGQVLTQQPVKATENRGYQPDFAWYPAEQCTPPDADFDDFEVSGDPALIVEVLSPSTRSFDLLRKRTDYERLGIDEVWFVDPPAQEVLIHRPPASGQTYDVITLTAKDTLASPLFPGLTVSASELFARPGASASGR